jgi:hypothetical protein
VPKGAGQIPGTRFGASGLRGKDVMRLFFRIVGTWLLGMALVLLIIDGTRSLAANGLVISSLGDTWTLLHAQSLEEVRLFLATRFFGPLLEGVIAALLALPAWVVLGVPGAFIAWLGRTRRSRVFVRQDQI